MSKGSGGAKLSNLNLLSPGVGGGGAVDQQFKDEINKRLEEQGDGLDDLKEQLDELK